MSITEFCAYVRCSLAEHLALSLAGAAVGAALAPPLRLRRALRRFDAIYVSRDDSVPPWLC